MGRTLERRANILSALRARKYDTRANLAHEFGVSKRTIENDILHLSLTHPIITIRGNGGGIKYVANNRVSVYLSPCQETLLKKLSSELTDEREIKIMQDIISMFSSKG